MDLFHQADSNTDGKLSFEEWADAFGHIFNPDQLHRLFKDFDTAQTGYLTSTEFMEGFKNSRAATALRSSESEDDLVLDSIPLIDIESVERVELPDNVHRETSARMSLKDRSPFRTSTIFGRALSTEKSPTKGASMDKYLLDDSEAFSALEGWIYKKGEIFLLLC